MSEIDTQFQMLRGRETRENILMNRVRQDLAQGAVQRMRSVQQYSPDDFGRAERVSEETGVPAARIIEDPQSMYAREHERALERVFGGAPRQAGWVAEDPANAIYAQDEAELLARYGFLADGTDAPEERSAFREGLRAAGLGSRQMIQGVNAFMASGEIDLALRNLTIYDTLDAVEDLTPMAAQQIMMAEGLSVGDPRSSRSFAINYAMMDEAQRGQLRERAISRLAENEQLMLEATRAIINLQAQMPEGEELTLDNLGDWAAFNFGSGGPYLLAAMGVALATGGTGALVFGGALALGETSSSVILEGGELDRDTRIRALRGALVSGGLEVALGPVSRVLGNAVLRTPLDYLEEQVRRGLARRVGMAITTDAVEEGMQEVFQQIIQDWAVDGVLEELNEETITQYFEVFAAGALLGGTVGGVTGGVQAQRDATDRRTADAEAGERESQTIEQVNETVGQTQLRDRSPRRWRSFLQRGGFEQRTIYIDAEPLVEFARDNPEAVQLLGLNQTTIDSAAETGGLVGVNMATYMTNVPGRQVDLERLFVQHGRTNVDTESATRAQEIRTSETVERTAERVAIQTVEQARDQIFDGVMTQVSGQLRAAGRTQEDARASGTLTGAFFRTLAARTGDNSVTEQYRIAILGPGTGMQEREQAGRVLPQGAQTALAPQQEPEAAPEPAPLPDPLPGMEDVLQMVQQPQLDPAAIMAEPRVQEVLADMGSRPETINEVDLKDPETYRTRAYRSLDGIPIAGVDALYQELDTISAKYAGGEVRQERRMDILLGPPAAGKSTIAEEFIAPEAGARIVDSDDVKKLIPEFDGGIGAAAVHEESSILSKGYLADAMDRGDNIVLPRVGDKAASIEAVIQMARDAGYTVNLVNMAVEAVEPFRRNMARFATTGRLVPPEYVLSVGDKPTQVYEQLKETADGYASYDNNVPFGQKPVLTEDTREGADDAGRGEDGRPDRDGSDADLGAGEVDTAAEPRPDSGAGEAEPARFRVLKQSAGRRAPENVGRLTGVEMPTNLATASELARNNRFARGRDFKVALQEMAAEGLDNFDDDTARKLADFAIEDALEAVQDNRNAIGWYDRKVTAAKEILREIYPELEPGSEAEFVFTWALAVTSNGVKVVPNFQLAARVYEQWRTDGTFPRVQYGTATEGINIGLQMFFRLREQFDSWEAMRDYMVGRHEVREIEARTGIEVGGEAKGEIVAGAAVLGPKIGNGFFSNLYGYFDMLTMDRWLMRTVGRWRGTLISTNEELIAANRAELNDLLTNTLSAPELDTLKTHLREGLSRPQKKRYDTIADKIGKAMEDADLDLLSDLIKRASAKVPWRDAVNEMPGGDLFRRLGNRLNGNLDGQNEDPSGAADRTFLRKVFGLALEQLQQEPGMEQLTMADLQALLWYPEKLLYDSAKKKAGEEVRSYEDDEAPDYENAARALRNQKLGSDGDELRGTERGSDVAGSEDVQGGEEGGGRRLAQSGARAGGSIRQDDGGATSFRGRSAEYTASFDVDGRTVYEVTDAALFGDLINEAKEALGPLGAQVTAYDDYSNMRLFLFDGGSSGFALNGDDIISVFSSPDSASGVVDTVLTLAVQEGGRRLDAFNTFLPRIYAKKGFRSVARLPFNREFAPEGWDYDYFERNFGTGEPDVAFMVYDPENATADTDNVVAEYDDGMAAQDEGLPRELAQSDRGQILISAEGVARSETVIELFKNADASTYLHEAGHFFLEVMQDVAKQDAAPQQIKDDMRIINEWMGRAPDSTATFSTAEQEMWAEAFENYLLEGRAPSASLKTVFSKFATWLGEVYRRLTRPGTQPSPEVKEVMDRMLATDQEIEAAKAQYDSQALYDEIPPGMTEAEWTPYVKVVQKEEAETKGRALERAMAKIRRRRTKEWKAREKELRAQVEEELRQEGAYRVIEGLGNGGYGISARLDKKALVALFGEQVLQDLTRARHKTKTNLYVTDGSEPQVLADMFGYRNVVEMVNDLRSTKPLSEAVDERVQRQLDDELGDPEDNVSIREEAEAALKNGYTTERVSRELASIQRQLSGARTPTRWQQQNSAAKASAEQKVAALPVRDVLGYRQFLRASQKAAREAQRNLSKVVRSADGTVDRGSRKFLQEAAGQKRKQLLNDHMYRIAQEKAARYKAARIRFRRYSKKTSAARIGEPFMDTIQGMLDRYNFREVPVREVQRRTSLRETYTQMLQEGRGMEIAFDIDVIMDIQTRHYTELTSDELDGVIAAIDNLAHMGRATQKQMADERARDLALDLDAIAERADQNLKSKPVARESRLRGSSLPRQFLLHVLNTDTLLRDIDGEQSRIGPAYRAIKEKIDKGIGRVQVRREQAARDMADIYKRNLGRPSQVAKLANDHRVYEGIEEHGPLSRLGLLALALNSGNADNWERTTNPDGARTYDARKLQAALVRELTTKEWKFVQEMWDYLDSYWPEISAQERKFTGQTPQKVRPRLMIEGAPAFVRGGYYPIRYDHGLSNVVDDMQRSNLVNEGRTGMNAKAQTAQGHANERKGSTKLPIDVDLAAAQAHVFQVIQDLELRGPVRDAGRIIYSQRFQDILRDKGRLEDHRALKSWLEDVAIGDRVGAYGASRFFRWMRGGFVLSAIGFKMSTVILQLFGVTQSVVQVGTVNFARGTFQYLRGPKQAIDFAMQNSDIMKERIRTFDKDINQITSTINAGASAEANAYKRWLNVMIPWAYIGMQYMQFYAVDMPTWMAAHESALREGLSPEDAITAADRDVRVAQGSGLMSDRGALERGRLSPEGEPTEWARLFTVLGSYMFGKFNLAYRRVRGTDIKNPAAVAKLTADLMTLFVIEAMAVYVLRNGWPDGEEEDDEYENWYTMAATEGIHTAMGTLPVLRDVSSVVKGFGGGSSYADYVDAAGGLVNSVTGAAAALSEGEGLSRRSVEGFVGFGGTVAFMPSGTMNAMLDAIFENDWDVEDEWLINTLEVLTGLPLGGEDES